MHLSDNAFHDWCMQEFPDLKPKMRERMMQVGRRFGTQYIADQFPITVLYELAAPSVPDELIEDIMSLYNSTMAGIFGKFSDGCGISYEYSKQINGVRKVGCNPQNFSAAQGENL